MTRARGYCRAVVTGGAGFIGSHVCDVLIQAGSSVVCVDNFLTGTRGQYRPPARGHETVTGLLGSRRAARPAP